MSDHPDRPYSMGCRVAAPDSCSICGEDYTPEDPCVHLSVSGRKAEAVKVLGDEMAEAFKKVWLRPSITRQIFPVTEIPPEEPVDLEGVHEDV